MITKEKRQKVFSLDGNKCLSCGSIENLTIDHIFPKSLGGTDRMSNLQTLCEKCNRGKAAKIKAGISRGEFKKYATSRRNMDRIISSDPINRESAIICSQNNCSDHFFMDRQGLRDKEAVLRKRIAEIKNRLGIRDSRHWKNIRYRLNKHQQVVQWRNIKTREEFEELINLCDSHRKIADELERYRTALREHAKHNAWTEGQRSEHRSKKVGLRI